MMNRLFLIILTAFFTFLAFQQNSFAVCSQGLPDTFTCDTTPPNPDPTGIQQLGNLNNLTINVLPGAGIDTIPANGGNGGTAIQAGNGNDNINVDNGDVSADSTALEGALGNDQITVNNSDVFSENSLGISSGPGEDTITVTDSTVIGDEIAIGSGPEDDVVTITDSIVTSLSDPLSPGIGLAPGDDIIVVTDSTVTGRIAGISGAPGNDRITVIRSKIIGDDSSINGSTDSDIIELGTAAELDGIIDCGTDFDTIVFEMDVPEELLSFFSGQIAAATVPDGSVTINGLFYEWENCELLVNELVGVQDTRPIPTLSEWGLVALAAAMGVFGIFYAVRRRAAADA